MSVHLNLRRRLTVVAVALMALAGLAVASGQRASATSGCGSACIIITNNGGSGGGGVTVMDRWCGVNHGSRPCPSANYRTISPDANVTTYRAFAIAGGCSGYVTWWYFDGIWWRDYESYPIDRHGTDALWTQVTWGWWARVSQTCG